MGVIAGAVVAAGAAAGTTYLKGRSQKNALNAQRKALENLQKIDVAQYRKAAVNADKQAYLRRFRVFREGDPELAKSRDVAISNLYQALADKESNQSNAQVAADKYFREATSDDAAQKRFEASLLNRAQEKLDLGEKLSGDEQAEIVRTLGLEKASATGFGANREGPIAQMLAKGLPSEQRAIARQREQDAQALATGAANLRTNRLSILQGVAPALQNVDAARLNQAGAALNLIRGEMPGQIGLSGADVLALREANRNLENQKVLGLGDIRAQRHIVSGETAAGYLGAGTSGLTGILGGLGGGMGGSTGGGGMGGLGGLLGGGGGGGGGFSLGSISGILGGGGGGIGGYGGGIANPYFGASPGSVPYQFSGTPSQLVASPYITPSVSRSLTGFQTYGGG